MITRLLLPRSAPYAPASKRWLFFMPSSDAWQGRYSKAKYTILETESAMEAVQRMSEFNIGLLATLDDQGTFHLDNQLLETFRSIKTHRINEQHIVIDKPLTFRYRQSLGITVGARPDLQSSSFGFTTTGCSHFRH